MMGYNVRLQNWPNFCPNIMISKTFITKMSVFVAKYNNYTID